MGPACSSRPAVDQSSLVGGHTRGTHQGSRTSPVVQKMRLRRIAGLGKIVNRAFDRSSTTFAAEHEAGWHNLCIYISMQNQTMFTPNTTNIAVADTTAPVAPKFELDFESDEPLPVCPMRQDGSSSDEVCEACQ